ncbi:uncharacterized protein FOMMEDRAFT_25027 [Fomitiporia mediterranea MF3/22]|uniref:uncharacterized protein n=1 Tax=Fomitiporia mediterranea (strain MF3/22) TaxID=694068 RepID=UPI000440805D|nr:uncharacterized protein FOMMEDRAFT_25027 [Fomitiporia mediterranea MF3/22]EJD07739.1 hypothetical protein FOMMEDRAFT_25027 [Fomitiporia mediterranea MF3/22]
MRSLGLFALASAAILPFVSAAPLVDVDTAAAAKAGIHARTVDVAAGAKAGAAVHARTVTGVASILASLQVKLGDSLCELHHFTAQNATADKITPVLKGVVSVMADAVVDVKALKGKPKETIMASIDGSATVTVSEIAQLLANVLCGVFLTLSSVLSVVADAKILLNVVASVKLGGCLCDLINAVTAVVGGLLVELVPHVKDLASLLISLSLSDVKTVLNI